MVLSVVSHKVHLVPPLASVLKVESEGQGEEQSGDGGKRGRGGDGGRILALNFECICRSVLRNEGEERGFFT